MYFFMWTFIFKYNLVFIVGAEIIYVLFISLLSTGLADVQNPLFHCKSYKSRTGGLVPIVNLACVSSF